MASNADATTYDTPEETAAAIVALAATPDAFSEAIAADPALFAAVAAFADADELWLEALVESMHRAGMTKAAAGRFRSMVRTKVKDNRKAARAARAAGFRTVEPDEGPPLARDVLGANAPVPVDAVVPANFKVGLNGITRFVETESSVQERPVAYRPIVITGVMADAAAGIERLRVSWFDRGRWHSITVDRDAAMTKGELAKLSRHGMPVNSGNAAGVVQFLAAWDATNADVTPRLAVSANLGWQDQADAPSFLCGTRLLKPGRDEVGHLDATELPPESWEEDWIAFHASGAGDRQVAKAFAPAGTFEAWREAIGPVAAHPRAALGIYASLAAPLLKIVNTSPFMVDWCGRTSRGKTTTLMLAASVWGNPDPEAGASVVGNWNSTKVYIERRASMLNGLPVIVDDTMRANPKDVASLVYMFAGGQGRGRGDRDGGVRESGSWRTIALSTGEMPAVSYSQNEGTRGRVLTIWGSPFDDVGGNTGETVAILRHKLVNAHGHAGPRFVRWLIEQRDQWDDWKAIHAGLVQERIRAHGGDPVAGRIAQYAATIQLAAALAHEAGLLPWEYADPIDAVWADLAREAGDADRAADALRAVHGWSVSKIEHFEGNYRKVPRSDGTTELAIPVTGAIGRWIAEERRICFVNHMLRDFLEQRGYDVEGVIRSWADRGWLEMGVDGDKRKSTRTFRLNGKVTRGFVVPIDAFEEAGVSAESGQQGFAGGFGGHDDRV